MSKERKKEGPPRKEGRPPRRSEFQTKARVLLESVSKADLALMYMNAIERVNDLERDLQECRGGVRKLADMGPLFEGPIEREFASGRPNIGTSMMENDGAIPDGWPAPSKEQYRMHIFDMNDPVNIKNPLDVCMGSCARPSEVEMKDGKEICKICKKPFGLKYV